ncbi:MAG: hypothetical protein JWM93_1511 [Frankiales bacterium]|nr:hypothetical protein [Frankiales bacterium]
MSDVPEHQHTVSNGKRDITLDELAQTQPGLDRLMAELGPRMHRLYYSGLVGNWEAAAYFYRSAVKQLQLCAWSRPKYADAIGRYVAEDCAPVSAAIEGAHRDEFLASYQRMVDRANDYHRAFSYGFIVWKTPAHPPEDLDLEPTNHERG